MTEERDDSQTLPIPTRSYAPPVSTIVPTLVETDSRSFGKVTAAQGKERPRREDPLAEEKGGGVNLELRAAMKCEREELVSGAQPQESRLEQKKACINERAAAPVAKRTINNNA